MLQTVVLYIILIISISIVASSLLSWCSDCHSHNQGVLSYLTVVPTVSFVTWVFSPPLLCCRCSILACSAYVALALGDNLMALNHADKLLQQPKLSGSLK